MAAGIDFFRLALKAAEIADTKKAADTVVLDVRDLTSLSDYFVITTAESAPQINAISQDIEKTFKTVEDIIPVRREGISSPSWRVIDYGGLIVHIMSPQIRASYDIENVWHKAKVLNARENKCKTNIPPTDKKLKHLVGIKDIKTGREHTGKI